MEKELIPELITEAAQEFNHHLELEKNDRILFSGKFGKGKTTFLKEFFGHQEKYVDKNKYDVIFLDPVNYAVSGNEDIMKYIKYDILLQLLLRNNEQLDTIKFSFPEVAKYYLSIHPWEPVKSLLAYVPKVGNVLKELIPVAEKVYDKIVQQKKNAESATEDAHATSFITELQNATYSIYENDVITELIRALICECGDKQQVLVIDNLDRIDPDHIFRILNVFSAHLNYNLWDINLNKFRFDKVILVCDIQNIRNIYANRYGSNVDFSGYIDKFYSVEIFYFQNYDQLRKVGHKKLRDLQIRDARGRLTSLNEAGADFGIFHLITTLVTQNLVSLRQLDDFCSYPMMLDIDEIGSQNGDSKSAMNTPLVTLTILSKILSGYEELRKALADLIRTGAPMSNHGTFFNRLVHFRLFQKFGDTEYSGHVIELDGRELTVTVQGDMRHFSSIKFSALNKPGTHSVDYVPSCIDFYRLLGEILQEFHLQKYIE